MSASNAFETALLSLILQNANIANIGDATGLRGSSTAGVLYISLHTADPGEAGSQTTSEANYTSYARVSVARNNTQWTVSGTAPTLGTNANAITFPAATGGSSTVTHFGIGTDSSGAGNLLLSGALGASLAITSGITPNFAAGELEITAD
jgi:hypothetical protein